MAALIVSHQRASKNRFLSNFIQYRKHQGWKIQVVKDDESLEQVGKDLFEIGAAISEQEWKGAILNASVMDLIQFLQFSEQLNSKDQEYSNDQYYSYLRTRIELFYGQVLDESLLEQDRKGVRRREILLFEDLSKLDDLTFQSMLEVNSKKSDTKNIRMRQRLFRDRQTRCWLVYGLLSSTPIFKDGKFDTETVFVAEDLKKFVKASVQLQDVVLTQLDVNTQRDIDKKPVQHLGKILAKIGLTFKKPKTSTVAGKKTYFYALDLDSLRKLEEISRVRSGLANEGWDFVNQQYGFEYDALDMEWLEARQDHRLSPAQTPKPQNISHIVKFRQEPI